MPVGDKIRTVDYNSVHNKLNNLIGAGAGNFGWGQKLNSVPVSESKKIGVSEWALLRDDIINGFRHIYSGTPSTVTPIINNIIKYNATGTTPTAATEPVIQYDRWADQLIANRFTVHPTQAKTVNKGSRTRTASWSVKVECTVTVTFTSATQARYFFNSGGEIRLSSTRSGGASSAQNTSWTNLLNSAGVRRFGAQLPTAGFSPLNGQNFYRLTNNYQQWSLASGSGVYSTNDFKISARSRNVANNSSGSANIVDFLVEWVDSYTDPGPPLPADIVNGTLTISATTLEASGVLVPSGLGDFTVESPAISYSAITGS